MSDRERIIEAMAAAIRRERERPAIRSLEWSQKAPERMATAALDAALPLIREAFAEQVRSKALGPDFGRNPMSGADSRDARLYGAYDDGLECAARLIEEVEL